MQVVPMSLDIPIDVGNYPNFCTWGQNPKKRLDEHPEYPLKFASKYKVSLLFFSFPAKKFHGMWIYIQKPLTVPVFACFCSSIL
jgi:hypothetical protein